MEFWGVEVKSGETLVVQPGDEMVLHLSQACLGEVKKDKGNLSVFLYVRNGDQKIVLGTLSAEKFPQICFDLVFEKEFVLSHNWKNGSVYFSGYRAPKPPGKSDYSDSDISLGEPLPQNVKSETQAKEGKPSIAEANVTKPDSAPKPKLRHVEPDDDDTEESDDDSSLRSSGSESDDDEDMHHAEVETGGRNKDDKDDESDEETPKKAAPSKKRPTDSAAKTLLPDKKAKFVTPQKTVGADGKKGAVHVATPHPSKQAGKTAAKTEKSKQQQSPKSAGAFKCDSCNRSFNSDIGLQSHTKAKHSAAK